MRESFARSLILLAFALASAGLPARAQEVTNEESEVRHIFDDTPVWEADADASVQLIVPTVLTVCRQGRVVRRGGYREAHMGCWSQDAANGFRLEVPSGPGFLAVRHGLDLSWIGDGATALHDGDILRLDIDDHLAVRIVGWVVLALAVADIAFAAVALGTRLFRSDIGPFVALIVGGAAVVVGIAMVFAGDGVRLSFAHQSHPPAE
jgi:hypothetical protein